MNNNITIDLINSSQNKIYINTTLDSIRKLICTEPEIIVIIDKNVDKVYGQYITHKKIVIEPSEEHKTLSLVEYIIRELLFLEATRSAFLIGVGGGITTDVVGFVASIYKRGVRFAFIPTSLVGQIDASIGGKTGVNFAGYKNIAGVINQPEFSYINTSILKSLPTKQFAAGISEMIKTFIIGDREAFIRCIELFKNGRCYSNLDFTDREAEIFKQLVLRAIEIKCQLVKNDIRDDKERRKLNLGHTFGHAIERCFINGGEILHGEAVSIGITISALISKKMGYLSNDDALMIENSLKEVGLPTKCTLPIENLITAIKNDKKREKDFINFVFICSIGDVSVEQITINKLYEIANDLY